MSFEIPEDVVDGLILLKELGPENFDKVRKALASWDTAPNIKDLAEALKRDFADRPASLFPEIIWALISLLIARESFGDEPDFAENLFSQLRRSRGFADMEPEEFDPFLKNLTDLLTLQTGLGMMAKAIDLLNSHDLTVNDCRIFTDVRTVFGEDISEPPNSAVLFHTLKLDCSTQDGGKTIFLTTTDKGIAKLKEAIERAEQKSATLRGLLKDKAINCLPM